jgi:pentapeptide repeat protein
MAKRRGPTPATPPSLSTTTKTAATATVPGTVATRDEAERQKLEVERQKLDMERQKLEAETAKLKEEADKLGRERSRWGKILEGCRSIGAMGPVVIGLAALASAFVTMKATSQQWQNDMRKHVDTEFTAALAGLHDADAGRRMVGVTALRRFLGGDYESYHQRTITSLSYRLRLEPDPGTRALISRAIVTAGSPALPVLEEVRHLVSREILPLFDVPQRPPELHNRIVVLQHAFLETSRAISVIRQTPLDLSEARFNQLSLVQENLQGALLVGASLKQADLYKATLREADLQAADFTCANLQATDLRGAQNLSEDMLENTNWREAIFDQNVRTQLEQRFPAPQGTTDFREERCKHVH